MGVLSMEPADAKKFIMFWTWWRIEEDNNYAVNNIPDTFSAMNFGIDIGKLHVWYCVHHVKCLAEIKLKEIDDQYVKWTWLGINIWNNYVQHVIRVEEVWEIWW